MKLVYFTHSIRSCWNNGNAHFQRGLLREMARLGHRCVAAEPATSWSRLNLIATEGSDAQDYFDTAFPDVTVAAYEGPDIDEIVHGADCVIVHEWTEPSIASRLSQLRKNGRFILLFHDTHHRAITAPGDMKRYDFDAFDGILAFGRCLADVYERRGWERRCFVFHEAADIELFRPSPVPDAARQGIVWVGNWGDDERSGELETYLLRPVRNAGLSLDVFGVRYPPEALRMLERYGARYRGWLANAAVPEVFASALATVHVPRRSYTSALPGIPTIRVFETLACGIPLVCAPWRDDESLFEPGADFVAVNSAEEAEQALRAIAADADLRASHVKNGLETIRTRHTCRHRAIELVGILDEFGQAPREERAA